MEIRKMREGDVAEAYSLICSSLDEHFAPEVVSYFLAQWPSGQVVACDLSGHVIGYLAGARLSSGRCSIALFCIGPAYRSRGIGTMMLERFRHFATMEGMSAIQLEVKESNLAARRFYTRNGFSVTETLPAFYNDGSTGIRMVSTRPAFQAN